MLVLLKLKLQDWLNDQIARSFRAHGVEPKYRAAEVGAYYTVDIWNLRVGFLFQTLWLVDEMMI